MIGHGTVGMVESNLSEFGITTIGCRPHQQFQIHHIVNDNGAIEILVFVPTLDGFDLRAITGDQRHGCCIDGFMIFRIIE